jgi:hypothetical protein
LNFTALFFDALFGGQKGFVRIKIPFRNWYSRQQGVCFYAGRRINFHLFIHYQQRFRPTDFFSTFVRNLNFNSFNWADGRAGRALNASTAASPVRWQPYQNDTSRQ